MSILKKMTIMQKLLLSYSLLVLGITILMGIYILPLQLHTMEDNLESKITDTAYLLSQDSEIITGTKDQSFPSDLIQKLDQIKASCDTSVDYIVIADCNSIRLYHPDHSCIGQSFSGGDEKNVLRKGSSYITTRQGEHDVQKRAFAPILDTDGSITGFVMVSASIQTIHEQERAVILQFILIFVLILLTGVVVAYLISRNIRSSLLGFEPGTFTNMYLQREEILDNLDEGIFAVNMKDECLYCNTSARDMLKDMNAVRNSAIYDQIQICRKNETSILNQMIEIGENTFVINLIPLIRHGHTEAVLTIIRNKTELTKMAEQLTGTNHVIDAMRANTHEYMNKLHVISGLLQIGDIEEAKKYISNVSTEIEVNYQTVIRQIQNKTIAALLLGKQNRARELNIDFILRKDSSLELHSPYLSTRELVTIIGNLIENAFEACKGEFRQVELYIGAADSGLTITVDDTGCGMSKQQIEKIYEGQYTTKGEGHGFGLRLIQETVSQHHGYLEIESEPGLGTSFTLYFDKRREGYD